MASRNVSNTFMVTDNSVQLHKETILKEMNVLFCIPQEQSDSGNMLKLPHKTKTKLRDFSPRADYTDRAAAAGRRS